MGFDFPKRRQPNRERDYSGEVECCVRGGWVGEQQPLMCMQGPEGKSHWHPSGGRLVWFAHHKVQKVYLLRGICLAICLVLLSAMIPQVGCF